MAGGQESPGFGVVDGEALVLGQVTTGAVENVARDPAAFARFQQAQDSLSSALSRLMVVVEKYPDLKATAGFRDLGDVERAELLQALASRSFRVISAD